MPKQHKWHTVFCPNATPVQQVAEYMGVKIAIKRDDLNHKIIQGNKLRKLKYNIKYALEHNFSQLATFGGAWSNHLIATAQAAHLMQIKSSGFIRGDELENTPEKWSPTLINAQNMGMKLVFLSRHDYRKKVESRRVQRYLNDNVYLIPEGGSNTLALQGVAEIITELAAQIYEPSHIITACGTAGTMAGLIDGVGKKKWKTTVIGIPVLKGASFLNETILRLSKQHKSVNWQLYLNYHAGGYAKTTNEVVAFAQKFNQQNRIALDKIYTSKAFYAAYDLINRGEIPPNSDVVLVHTGGLQGGVLA